MPRHIPGNPSVVVQNLPGAGSMTAANTLYNTAPKSGSQLGMFASAVAIEPLLGNASAKYDITRFEWVGNLDQATGTCSTWKGSGLNSFDDMLNKTILLAAVAPSGVASEYPRALNALYGTRIKVIHGYVGTGNIVIAMQNYLAQVGQWVTVIQGVIFVICVLAFRRGVIGEIAHLLRIKL